MRHEAHLRVLDPADWAEELSLVCECGWHTTIGGTDRHGDPWEIAEAWSQHLEEVDPSSYQHNRVIAGSPTVPDPVQWAIMEAVAQAALAKIDRSMMTQVDKIANYWTTGMGRFWLARSIVEYLETRGMRIVRVEEVTP